MNRENLDQLELEIIKFTHRFEYEDVLEANLLKIILNKSRKLIKEHSELLKKYEQIEEPSLKK